MKHLDKIKKWLLSGVDVTVQHHHKGTIVDVRIDSQGLPEVKVQKADGSIHTWIDRDGIVRDYIPRNQLSYHGKK